MNSVRVAKFVGAVAGVTIGCVLGMAPLVFGPPGFFAKEPRVAAGAAAPQEQQQEEQQQGVEAAAAAASLPPPQQQHVPAVAPARPPTNR